MTNELTKPTFIISMGTKLIWGYVKYPSQEAARLMKNEDEGVSSCMDTLSDLFEKHNIPATWAVVGHRFLDYCECEGRIPHGDLPGFKEDRHSSYPPAPIYKKTRGTKGDVIEKVLPNRIEHEIGYHSFSDVVFSECGKCVAEAEIKDGVKLTKEIGITLDSVIFHENKIVHVDILKENGFERHRGMNRFRLRNPSQNILIRKFNYVGD